MGIDVEFLNALPDDMRQEVLDQHVREQAPEQAGSNSISNDFLDALPADIRNEIIEQERIEAARRERAAAPPVAAAALDPEMRAAVLNEEDPAFLNSLSPDLLAEVNQMRERLRNNRAGRAGASSSAVSGKKAEKRDAVQLVDKAAVMSLLRLLFVPEPVSKTLIMRLLGNVAENSKTRVELLTVLLCLLNEGCADLAAVDKLFGGKGKGKVVGGGISNLVELRCLEALGELVKGNSAVVPWFVTENEGFFAVLGKTPREKAKKGKGKLGEGRIPVVVLLEMLGRDGYLQSGVGGMMEHLMHLLSWILKPREVLKAVDGVEEKAIVEEVKALEPVVEVGAASPMDTSSTPVLETGVVEAVAEKKLEVKKTPEPLFELEVSSIPEQYVRSVINVLTGSDCPNKTFAYTMTVIQHLLSLKKYETIVIKELVESVHELGKAIIPGLEDLLEVVKKDGDKTEIISTFSKPSSTQSKLLRVLKSLDFIYAKNVAKRDVGSLKAVYDDFKLSDVWISLGLCLEVINTKSDLISVGTILLPLIEAFLVVSKPYIIVGSRQHAPSTTKDMKRKDARLMSNEELFVAFTEDHRKILNTMVRNNTSLMSGSFSLLVQNPKGLDFDNKRTYFTQVLHKRSSREQYGPLQLNVRREFVFEDSYQQMQGRTGPEVKHGKLSVRFYEEEGVDAGGVTREWFSELARQLFNPNYALFKPAAVDKITYQPNRSSWINPDHLFYFKFVGRIIGKAIYDARLLDCYFTRSFYKFMLGVAVDWKDMEAVDPEFHKSLEWILGNDITDVLDLTFCCEVDDFGRMKNVDLKEGGSGIPVTEENKLEYILVRVNWLDTSS
jgi:E3 ubiquitin-protein ligase HUWE1